MLILLELISICVTMAMGYYKTGAPIFLALSTCVARCAPVKCPSGSSNQQNHKPKKLFFFTNSQPLAFCCNEMKEIKISTTEQALRLAVGVQPMYQLWLFYWSFCVKCLRTVRQKAPKDSSPGFSLSLLEISKFPS